MSDAEVDVRVYAAVEEGARTFNEICIRVGLTAITSDFTVVDRSLRRLRQENKVYFDKKEQTWHVVV